MGFSAHPGAPGVVRYDTISDMKRIPLIAYAMIGSLFLATLSAGCGVNPDAARKQLIIASNDELIFILDGVNGDIFELKELSRWVGGYRQLPYEGEEGDKFFDVAQMTDDGVAEFYGRNSSGAFKLSVSRGEEQYEWTRTLITLDEGKSIVAARGDELILASGDGTSLEKSDGTLLTERPAEKYNLPAVTGTIDNGWAVVWPEKLVEPVAKGKVYGLPSLLGYGRPGRFEVQGIDAAGEVTEYSLEDDSFVDTKATSIVAAVVNKSERLILLDDKGYLSAYNGTELVSNVFGQVVPSKLAVNTMSLGPDDAVIVTDSVSRMASMIDPVNGDVLCSWRLPDIRRTVVGGGVSYGAIAFDLVLLLVIIALVVRMRSRLRRHQVYRTEDGK